MSQIDIREPVRMGRVCELLLRVAEKPLDFIEFLELRSIPNEECIVAAALARQASAAIISSCVVELWSNAVCNLHALEPEFPFYPRSVTRFVAETRLPYLSYVSIYYSLCKKQFEGTATFQKIKTLVDLRHELEHDKPEPENELSTVRVDGVLRWKNRLEPLVGKESLLWLPRIRNDSQHIGFTRNGEPPVMKFMKYPIAKWAVESTTDVCKEMREMLFARGGRMKHVAERPHEELTDPRFNSHKDIRRLWQSGE